jgi:hypothetical protein
MKIINRAAGERPKSSEPINSMSQADAGSLKGVDYPCWCLHSTSLKDEDEPDERLLHCLAESASLGRPNSFLRQ